MKRPCDDSCYEESYCAVCSLRKARWGRSDVAPVLCHPTHCEGYYRDPQPPHMWPGEEPWFKADGTGVYDTPEKTALGKGD